MSALGSLLNAEVAMRHNDQRASAAWMRQAVAEIDFSSSPIVWNEGGWDVHVDSCLSMGWVAVRNDAMAIIFGPETYEALRLCPDEFRRVLHDLRNGASGLKMLTGDLIAKLVRIQELGIVRDDEVNRLEKLARQLILESADINSRIGVSAREIAIFTLRSSELQEAYKFLYLRVLNLQAVIDASTNAVNEVL